MNHFAHLALARPTVESTVGNLLGDFARGVDLALLPPAVRAGLDNHRAVDRYTDAHPLVKEMKRLFSRRRRRFAGVALDIYFDHLLVTHWRQLEGGDVDAAIAAMYARMRSGRPLMPSERMRRVTRRMVEHDWFGSYRDVDAVASALDRVAGRIRFRHQFYDAIEDLERQHRAIRDGFLEFYPELRLYVANLAIERN